MSGLDAFEEAIKAIDDGDGRLSSTAEHAWRQICVEEIRAKAALYRNDSGLSILSIPILREHKAHVEGAIGSASWVDGKLIFILTEGYTKTAICRMIGNAGIDVLSAVDRDGVQYIKIFQVREWSL